jgi:hypothetical protein
MMQSWYDHELTIVEDCLDPSLNKNFDLVNGPAIFGIIYLQLSWFPILQDKKTTSN